MYAPHKYACQSLWVHPGTSGCRYRSRIRATKKEVFMVYVDFRENVAIPLTNRQRFGFSVELPPPARAPSSSIELPRAPSRSLELPRAPSSSLALPRAPSSSLELPRSPSSSLALAARRSVHTYESRAHVGGHRHRERVGSTRLRCHRHRTQFADQDQHRGHEEHHPRERHSRRRWCGGRG